MPTDATSNVHNANDVPDEWDFYLCKVDDGPASIFLNLWFRNNGAVESANTLHWCQIEMLEPGDHGMGVGTDTKFLNDLEDSIAKKALDAGLFYVGRLRNHGRWQLAFYGGANLESTLRAIVDDVLSGRKYVVGSKADSEWSYYFDFLYPDAERWQWMMDRRVVEQLQSSGDPLTKLRRVDHWAFFESADRRNEFVQDAINQGFEFELAADDREGQRPYSAQIFRSDSVQLDDIHDIAMTLVRTAERFGGEYDGWETSVEKP